MSRRLVLVPLLSLLALALVPAAPAAENVACWGGERDAVAVGAEGATLYVHTYTGSWGSFVTALFVEVWREANGVDGLQVHKMTCSDGSTIDADWRHAQGVVPDPRAIYCC